MRSIRQLVRREPGGSLATRLEHAGFGSDLGVDERLFSYRLGVGITAGVTGVCGCAVGLVLGLDLPLAFVVGAVGAVGGASLRRGRLDRMIDERRNLLRIELYAVEQVLAMRIRAGDTVARAITDVGRKAEGEVAADLRRVLIAHQSGVTLAAALRRMAALTPEPHAMRCYLALAAGDETGSDVAGSLMALSAEIRQDRREALRRAATRGRALMLVPIVGVLAPVLLLFIAAPLPWIVLRELGP